MKLAFNIGGAVLFLIGALWVLQGVGLVGGSFMTGDRTWLWIGLVVAIVGLGMLVWNNQRR